MEIQIPKLDAAFRRFFVMAVISAARTLGYQKEQFMEDFDPRILDGGWNILHESDKSAA